MNLLRWVAPGWLSNTYLLYDRPGGEGIVVDTGAAPGPVLEAVRERRLTVRRIVNTHHHIDHSGGNAAFGEGLGAEVVAHEADTAAIGGRVRGLRHGETFEAGALSARVLHIPGHTPGHLALLVTASEEGGEAARACVFTGDTLFRRSVGGTRAPGHGTYADLRRSILDGLLALPPETGVRPGHAASTTIGEEREENPFVRAWQGRDPEGDAPCLFDGRRARLLLRAPDYDGGTKAWIRFEDGGEEVVPGSRVVPARAAGG